jgi:hypothetical protein
MALPPNDIIKDKYNDCKIYNGPKIVVLDSDDVSTPMAMVYQLFFLLALELLHQSITHLVWIAFTG